MEKLVLLEFVIKDKNREYHLTEKGILVGGEAKKGRYGDYSIWPESLVIE
ncbi:DNA repair protein, partial [Francisella tularensis subsp. holarctica]|nr:DNA repair protein [Francisella tularensis subsp. holarctica]